MHSLAVFLGVLTTAFARPQPVRSICSDIQIPVTIAVPRFIINTTIENDWDAAALTLNLTRRDFSNATDPLPIYGSTNISVKSTYSIGATICGTGPSMLVLTHGIIESKLYWQPTFENAEEYNFVDAAVTAGYSVLSYDRIGVGSSSKVSATSDAQFPVETAVLNSLIHYARTTANATKVSLVGHSYGSYISAASASQMDVDSVVLTGFSGSLGNFGLYAAGAGFRVAKTHNASRWGELDPGYLTSSDLYAETYIYYAEPYFEHRVAEWSFNVASEPFAFTELPTLLATNISYANVTAPVFILQGEFDVSACGGYCIGLLDAARAMFSGAKALKTVDDLPAGHNLNLHKVAPQAFKMIFDFLKTQGV